MMMLSIHGSVDNMKRDSFNLLHATYLYFSYDVAITLIKDLQCIIYLFFN